MSWHYLQEGEAVSWAESYSGGLPGALLSMLPAPETFCSHDRQMGLSNDSQSGTTSQHSTATPGVDTSTWSLAGSLAKTSRRRRRALLDWPEKSLDYFGRCCESLARYGLSLSLPKTLLSCGLEGLSVSYTGLPAWGMTHDGAYSELSTSGPRMKENDFGCWPTTICGKGTNFQRKVTGKMDNPEAHAFSALFLTAKERNGSQYHGGANCPFREWMMGWPIGWADAGSPLSGTGRYQQWRQLHSTYFPVDSSDA